MRSTFHRNPRVKLRWVRELSPHSPFEERGRNVMPALLTTTSALPANTLENQVACVETRVLYEKYRPHPYLCPNAKGKFLLLPPTLRLVHPLQKNLTDRPAEAMEWPDYLPKDNLSRERLIRRIPLFPGKRPLRNLTRKFFELSENKYLHNLEPMKFEEWVKRYPLGRQKDLNSARSSLMSRGLTAKDAVVNCFIKNEVSVKGGDPRNISPRTDIFLAALGPYVSAIEDSARTCKYLVKGTTQEQKHERLAFINEFNWLLETDYSRFDSTLDQEVLFDFELELFLMIFPAFDNPEFADAMRFACTTMGVTPLGILYHIIGQRMSGDAHTSMGNALVGRFVQWAVLRNLPRRSWRSVHEGDDGLTASNLKYRDQILTNLLAIRCMGFNLKIIEPKSAHHAIFVGRTIVPLGDTVRMHCDVKRTLGKFHITTSSLPGRRATLAKALSYYYTDRNTPVIGPLCYNLINILEPTLKDLSHIMRSNTLRQYEKNKVLAGYNSDRARPSILSESRRSVAEHSNIDIGLQLAMERHFDHWTVLGYVPHRPDYIVSVDDPHVDDERTTYYGNAHTVV
uniref:RNA-directed RNA polymerase n=1 Tax=Riboviria sp. TaxID=2585031 RepID=A0A8K1U4M8_9VIRU|nr:MAG: hypothetical protein 2 [Riboviria sp.]